MVVKWVLEKKHSSNIWVNNYFYIMFSRHISSVMIQNTN